MQYTFPIEQEIAPKKKRKVSVPLEDLELIICTGANIRLSTMALSALSENKVGLVTIGKDYMPASIVYNAPQFLEGRQPNKRLWLLNDQGLYCLIYRKNTD